MLKHGALVALATELGRAGLRFVDTHTFLLQAPLADQARWQDAVAARVASHPAYAPYVALERTSQLRSGLYRCSSGLMLDVLGGRGEVVLGEANPETRAELRAQLADEGHVQASVHQDAVRALEHAARGEAASPLLVHVDPFALTRELWAQLAQPLDALTGTAPDVAMVLYRYTRNAPSPWPSAPRGMAGPVAEVRGGPHELSAYASPKLAEAVRGIVHALGWRDPM